MKIKSKHHNGSHLVLDCYKGKSLGDKYLIRSFLVELCKKIGMRAISEPIVVEHNAPDPDESGITGMILIAESHISIHTYPEKGYFAFDIFSCKEFDIKEVERSVKNTFNPERIETNLIRRGHSETFSEKEAEEVKGMNIGKVRDVKSLVKQYRNLGFQATNLAKAADIVNKMKDSTVFLTFTSNMVSSGLREVFAYMCEKKMVDVIITGAGSIEEDLIKSKKSFLLGDFHMDDVELHKKGINRIGNILVPNDRYELLEDILVPFFDKMLKKKDIFSPSELVFELGKEIKDKKSILYWATNNNIPVFCPAITDGAFGLQIYFYKQKHDGFGIDVTSDMKKLAEITLNADKTGGIMLGGGFAKHHAIGVNILREGLDYAVYVSTATQYDGSVSGARTKEAVSWSKIKENSNSVFVEGDATILFPLIISGSL